MKKKLKIGHKDYTFEVLALAECGITHNVSNYIHVNKNLSDHEIIATTLHEIAHALSWVHGRHMEEFVAEEQWCDMTGNGMTMVFRDNPWLLKFITDKLKA